MEATYEKDPTTCKNISPAKKLEMLEFPSDSKINCKVNYNKDEKEREGNSPGMIVTFGAKYDYDYIKIDEDSKP